MRGLSFIDVLIRHAQILDLHATPIEVIRGVPSEIISIWKIDGVVDTSGGAYTEAGILRLRYGRALGAGTVGQDAFGDMTALAQGLTEPAGIWCVAGIFQPYSPHTDLIGEAVTLVNAGDAFLAGAPNNTLTMRIWYTTFPGAPWLL